MCHQVQSHIVPSYQPGRGCVSEQHHWYKQKNQVLKRTKWQFRHFLMDLIYVFLTF